MAILGSSSVLMNATEIQLFLFSSREKGSGGGGGQKLLMIVLTNWSLCAAF